MNLSIFKVDSSESFLTDIYLKRSPVLNDSLSFITVFLNHSGLRSPLGLTSP